MKTIYLMCAVLFFTSYSVHADMYFELGYELGGEKLAETSSGDSVAAGSGVKLSLGIQNQLYNGSSLRMAAGFLFDSVNAIDGQVDTEAVTLDLLYMINDGPHGFGVGATMHMAPEYDEKSTSATLNLEFEDAMGFVLQYAYQLGPKFEFGVKYSNLNYQTGSEEIDADSIGFYLSKGF